ncbi:MAG: LacI family DNA-binding transcriptional regulator [Acidobacteriota bacterium]
MVKKGIQVTLSDIAGKLGVSKVTVSKALRGHPDISRETVKKVKKVAKDLGYFPNYMARNLSSKHSNTIGVVVPKIAHFFFSTMIEAIYDVAFEHNYEIILTVSQEDARRELCHIKSLLSMRVDALIVSVTQQTTDVSIFHKVKEMGVPLTFVDRVIDDKSFNTVANDDRGGALHAVEHAINVGYTKLGFLGGYEHVNIGHLRRLGFEDALEKHHVPVHPEWIIHSGFGEEDGYNGFMQLCATGELPEFIFCASFPIALGVYRAAEELGIRIPNDLDLMCFGSGIANRFLSTRISCVDQPVAELGRKAMEITLAAIQSSAEEIAPQHVTLGTTLELADTCIRKIAVPKKIVSLTPPFFAPAGQGK